MLYTPIFMRNHLNKIRIASGMWIVVGVLLCTMGCKDKAGMSEYADLTHQGEKYPAEINSIEWDTLYIGAGTTSLEGQWLLKSDRLVYVDKHMVGVREYDLEGNFIRKSISRGKGPDEMGSPFFVSIITANDELLGLDGMWQIFCYGSDYHWTLPPFRFLSDNPINDENHDELLRNPHAEQVAIYEYNFNVRKLYRHGYLLFVPVVVEHVRFNGYDIHNKAKEFWRTSHIFATVDLNEQRTQNLFGTYPPVYEEKNIPNFSGYDFAVGDGCLYSAFAADTLIYIRDMDGVLKGSMGFSAPGISRDYPETKTFDEADAQREKQLKKYGYFTTLTVAGDYLFRGYKREGEQGYGLQIYKNKDLAGDIHTKEAVNILGYQDGFYYGELPVDVDNERFRIIRFKL